MLLTEGEKKESIFKGKRELVVPFGSHTKTVDIGTLVATKRTTSM
jgi:hypothetical protein